MIHKFFIESGKIQVPYYCGTYRATTMKERYENILNSLKINGKVLKIKKSSRLSDKQYREEWWLIIIDTNETINSRRGLLHVKNISKDKPLYYRYIYHLI